MSNVVVAEENVLLDGSDPITQTTSACELLFAEEAETRTIYLEEEANDLHELSSVFQADFSRMTRNHVCRLCLRWFGLTFANGHGHYTDQKTDLARRQRSRNRRPSYLICTTCADLPLLCHSCFRMLHIDDDIFITATKEGVQAELRRRDEQQQTQQTAFSPTSDGSAEGTESSVLSLNGGNMRSFDREQNVLLKRAGMAALAVSGLGGDRPHTTSPMPNDRRHIALELFSLDPQVVEKHRAAIRKWSVLSLHTFFESAFESDLVEMDRSLPWVPTQAALQTLMGREAERRAEIESIWLHERLTELQLETRVMRSESAEERTSHANASQLMTFPTLSVTDADSLPWKDTKKVTIPQLVLPLALGDESPSEPSPSSAEDHDPQFHTVIEPFIVDRFVLEFLSEGCDLMTHVITNEEITSRREIADAVSKCMLRLAAMDAATDAVSSMIARASAQAYFRQLESLFRTMFDEYVESVAQQKEEVTVKVIHELDGTNLLQRCMEDLENEELDDEGVPLSVRWQRLHYAESVARRQLWDEQVSSWEPMLRDAAWREQRIAQFLLSRSLLQQYNFQANQILRQYFIAHVSAVASRMSEYIEILCDKADKRVDQLTFQCHHATSRQEITDEERVCRWNLRLNYAASRLIAREQTTRRQLSTEAWQGLLKELPAIEKLQRFSTERSFVVEYRAMLRDFWACTRMDLRTIQLNMPHTFEGTLMEWTRRLTTRETTYFSFQREQGIVRGKCGLPIIECYVWPFCVEQQMSLFWCPTFGPRKKKAVIVQQGSIARSIRSNSKRSARGPTVGRQSSNLLSITGSEFNEVTPRSPRASASPAHAAKFVDDGPQPLLTALSVISSLLQVPSYTGARKFTCVALVEDVVCWNRVCQLGQVLLSSYPLAGAFEDLFATFDDEVATESERKWIELITLRERARLALLEQQIGTKMAPKQKSAPIAQSGRRKKKRVRDISDSASSVMSGDDTTAAASTVAGSSATDAGSMTSRSEAAHQSGHDELDSSISGMHDVSGREVNVLRIATSSLPNYNMRTSFFGSRFMFGKTMHVFNKQWLPPTHPVDMDAPEDVSVLWGVGLHRGDEKDSMVDSPQQQDDDDVIDSDFDDDAVAASKRQRGAFKEATAASKLRESIKYEDRVKQEVEANRAEQRKIESQMRRYWRRVHKEQESVLASQTAANSNGGNSAMRKAQMGLSLSPTAIMQPARRSEGSGVFLSLSPSRLSPSTTSRRKDMPSPSLRGASPQTGKSTTSTKSKSIVLKDAFDLFDE